MPGKARVLVGATVAAGLATVVAGAFHALHVSVAALALLGAAVVLTELIEVAADRGAVDPLDAHAFSFSSSVHLAAVMVVGGWAAALVAAFGVLVADSARGAPLRRVAYNASVFAIAAAAGGLVFQGLGGHTGALQLPHALLPILGLVLAYAAINTVLVSSVVAFTSDSALAPVVRDASRAELSAAAAEAGLGTVLAFFAIKDPWGIVVLVPLLFAIYLSHARLALLRRQTGRALETFANVVDERDPYTYRHSARVAESVRGLAEALRLPASEVSRLRWAGRLHDLGKIAVDAAILGKRGKLAADEWAAMRYHPRLSARLLRRFRLAAEEAAAVEYHHERYDGAGYYRAGPDQVPLAAHFLIVADSYDAMTSDRPYRRALSRERALHEIEANLGSQFHPAVGKAFVAFQRGRDPLAVLTPEEARELRHVGQRRHGRRRFGIEDAHEASGYVIFGGVIAALVLLGTGLLLGAVPALAAVAAAVAWRKLNARRAGALAGGLSKALATSSPAESFSALARYLAASQELAWAGLMTPEPDSSVAELMFEWSAGPARPSEASLSSWLLREADSAEACLSADGAEFGHEGRYLITPVKAAEGRVSYVVLGFRQGPAAHVEPALGATLQSLAAAFASAESRPAELKVASV